LGISSEDLELRGCCADSPWPHSQHNVCGTVIKFKKNLKTKKKKIKITKSKTKNSATWVKRKCNIKRNNKRKNQIKMKNISKNRKQKTKTKSQRKSTKLCSSPAGHQPRASCTVWTKIQPRPTPYIPWSVFPFGSRVELRAFWLLGRHSTTSALVPFFCFPEWVELPALSAWKSWLLTAGRGSPMECWLCLPTVSVIVQKGLSFLPGLAGRWYSYLCLQHSWDHSRAPSGSAC
jgi:hypothetical protein